MAPWRGGVLDATMKRQCRTHEGRSEDGHSAIELHSREVRNSSVQDLRKTGQNDEGQDPGFTREEAPNWTPQDLQPRANIDNDGLDLQPRRQFVLSVVSGLF